MSDRAASKIGLEVMPIISVTLSDGHGPGERAPSRRYARPPHRQMTASAVSRTGRYDAGWPGGSPRS
jgi:hypothetical protein